MPLLFYIPYMTTIQTHYHSINKVIVYFITYVIPEFLIVFFQNYSMHIDWKLYLIFIISFTSFVNLYEIGYIYNETETIKKETDPTKRLNEEQLAHYESRKIFIYMERFFVTVLLNVALAFLVSKTSLLLFSLEEVITLAVFFLYNSVRGGRITQAIYFLLSSLKYLAPVFCFSEKINLSIVLSCIFCFPIVRTLEYKAHYGSESNVNLFFRKYIIKYDINRIPIFRVFATFVILMCAILLYIFRICNMIPIILCAYMFLYRFFLWSAVKLGANFKGYLKR